MKDIIFRAAKIEDVPELVNLRFRAICETDGIDPNQRTPEFEKLVQDYFNETLSNQTYFGAVAELNGRLISTNGLVLYRKPPSFKGTNGVVGYVTNVYTIPEFRNLGIANDLMKLLIAHAKQAGATKIHLGATEDGRRLYEKNGFKDVIFPALELRF
ncbi:GNAT family N-acetyltransferase [Bdellovibrio sp. HCB337]|uniref:GNAT family N-acetyltransferase n=1 Tax=Bdellovibrio sp. HCB337 TaxID=3394358 RepID=UPI0039A5DD2B